MRSRIVGSFRFSVSSTLASNSSILDRRLLISDDDVSKASAEILGHGFLISELLNELYDVGIEVQRDAPREIPTAMLSAIVLKCREPGE